MKRSFGVLLVALLLGGCGGGGSSAPSTPVNPSTTVVTIDNAAATPLAGINVTLSTGLNGQTPTGVITTTATNAAGQVTFSLPQTGTLCVSATVTTGNSATFAGTCKSPPFPATIGLTLDV
jgi:hypothetical protein